MVIVSGPEVSHGITLSGFAVFLGLELKHTDQNSVFVVNRLEALVLRLFSVDQNLTVFMLEGVALPRRRGQVAQGAGGGQFESAICLSFPIPLAPHIFPSFLLFCLSYVH